MRRGIGWGLAFWGIVGGACGPSGDLHEADAAIGPVDAPLDASTPDAPADAPRDLEDGDAGGLADAGLAADAGASTEAGPWTPPSRAALIPAHERFASNTFSLGGQSAFFHDEGHAAGVFHTYDAFDACGPARRVHVFVPRDYAGRDERLAVLYFNDGNTTFWPGGVSPDTWDAAQAQSDLFMAGRAPRAILVALHPLEREREYTHAEWVPGRACCGVTEYAERVARCVAPWVDAHYRTSGARAIVGSSHGGLAAFFLATRHPEVFGFAGALSPSFWAGVDARADGTRGESVLEESALVAPVRSLLRDRTRRPALWIDWGLVRAGGAHNAIIEAMATDRGREMVSLLEAHGYGAGELAWFEDSGGAHDEASWGRRLPRVLERALAPR
ncbi:MAG: hypothetical protein KF901_15870 [Myxococcales bacterium]|nr:hypothetical protein [Myxococcales bacterium]